MKYVQVAVNVPQVSGVFDYHIPEPLTEKIRPGSLVIVPFSTQRVQGVVVREIAVPQVMDTRPVEACLDPQPVLTQAQLRLGEWLSDTYLAPLSACLDAMLPPGLSQHADTLYELLPAPPPGPALFPLQQQIVDEIARRGALRGRQLDAAFPRHNLKPALDGLVRRGWLQPRPVLPPPGVRPKVVRTAQLAVTPQQALEQINNLGRGEALARRQAAVRFLISEPLPVAVQWVYAGSGANLQDLQRLAEDGLVLLGETEQWRDPLENVSFVPVEPPPLSPGQQAAWEMIQAALRSGETKPRPILLRGVTGSGKTELYLRAVEETVAAGKQAVIMVPEIALTPQTVRRFGARFPGQVGLIHSRLSPGERYDTWRRARSGRLPVIVGPRSALFAPLPNLGLIVADECHDASYYQQDMTPAFSAIDAALAYSRLCGAVVLLGSATPSVEQTYHAERKHWTVIDLPERIMAHRETVRSRMEPFGLTAPHFDETNGVTASLPLPPVEVVDMREELKAGNRDIFSRSLKTALQETLQANQQAILFLNRRGSSTYLFCRSCGNGLRCPRCDLPLTLHTTDNLLHCHSCGYTRQVPQRCPNCKSTAFGKLGTGTERVEQTLHELLPEARVLRWDADTARQKGAHELMMAHFANHRADVLVGTQMLAKGLDLPLVTLVGVILADVGLNLPDFRANERTFQLLTQVAGRAGRSPLGGKVVLQTYEPDRYAIQAAARHDLAGFTERELAERRRLGYPPFTRLVRIEIRDASVTAAEAAAQALAAQLRAWIDEGEHHATSLIGPAPCYYTRQGGEYRWHILMRGPDPASILRGRRLERCRVTVDPVDVL